MKGESQLLALLCSIASFKEAIDPQMLAFTNNRTVECIRLMMICVQGGSAGHVKELHTLISCMSFVYNGLPTGTS